MQAPGSSSTGGADTIKFSDVVETARRWWRVLVGGAALGLVAAAVWVLIQVPHYRATAVLRVGEARDAMTSGIEARVREPERYVNPLTSQVQLISSRSLIGEVVDSVGFRLRTEYRGFEPGLLAAVHIASDATADTLWLEFAEDKYSVRTQRAWRRGEYSQLFDLEGVRLVLDGQPSTEHATWPVVSRDRAVDRLLGKLQVSARNETNIVDVSFDHPDPVTAQRIVNTLVTRYQAFDANFAQQRAGRRRIFLEEQLAQTDASLREAERRLTAFRNRAQTYDAREELAAQQGNRLTLDIRREELDADRRMFQTLLERVDGSTEAERWEVLRTLVSSPGIAENPVVSQLHQQLLRYRTSIDSLTTGAFGTAGTNPDVQRLRELMTGAEENLVGALWSHLGALDARAEALQELDSRMAVAMSRLPTQLAQEARLDQMVETYRSMVDQLREEYQKAGMAEAVAVGQVDIVDLATRPYKPLPGMRALKLVLGLLMGLALAGSGAFLLEHRNPSIRRREEVEALLHLPLLGVIPEARPNLAESGWRALPDGAGGREGDGNRIPTLATDGSFAREAYRMLRTNLLFGEWARDVKSLVVTSTTPREGKTLTSVHLAASIAEEGPRVLLIDGDLWRGRIHEMAGVPEAPGFAEMLAGEMPTGAVRSTGAPRLFLLPRGRSHPSPSSLTRSAEIRKVMDRFAEEYDVIIVDGPPVLATASGPALASVADGVMLVIRAGRTERQAVKEALKELDTVGARVVGAVLNDPSGTLGVERQHYYAYAKP
jgi:capsular exopolysaccharide synthesis family protein